MATLKVKIIGSGSYLPSRIVTNADVEKELFLDDPKPVDWVERRTGIKERRWSDWNKDDESLFGMAINAANSALKEAGVDDVDIISVARGRFTDPKSIIIASAVQEGLKKRGYKMKDVDYLDGFYICSGSVTALYEAGVRIAIGDCKRALVVGSSRTSYYCNSESPGTAFLWGDGAGAWILERSEDPGILAYKGKGFSDKWNVLQSRADCSGKLYVKMDGPAVFEGVVKNAPEIVMKTLGEAGVSLSDIDLFICHQANLRIIEGICKRLYVSMERFFVDVDKYGNTSCASVPIAYDDAKKQGKIRPGYLYALIGFGAGLHINCAIYRA